MLLEKAVREHLSPDVDIDDDEKIRSATVESDVVTVRFRDGIHNTYLKVYLGSDAGRLFRESYRRGDSWSDVEVVFDIVDELGGFDHVETE